MICQAYLLEENTEYNTFYLLTYGRYKHNKETSKEWNSVANSKKKTLNTVSS